MYAIDDVNRNLVSKFMNNSESKSGYCVHIAIANYSVSILRIY